MQAILLSYANQYLGAATKLNGFPSFGMEQNNAQDMNAEIDIDSLSDRSDESDIEVNRYADSENGQTTAPSEFDEEKELDAFSSNDDEVDESKSLNSGVSLSSVIAQRLEKVNKDFLQEL